MSTRTLRTSLAVMALAVAVPVHAADQMVERTLPVTGPVTMSVSTGSGDIVLHTGAAGAVKVVTLVKPNSSWGVSTADAEAAVKAVLANPPITQQGNSIEIGKLSDQELARRVSISFEITTPKATTLNARSGSGDISVDDLGADVSAQAGSGDISIKRVDGAVKAQVGSGDIVVSAARSADVSTGSGDVNVGEVSGAVSVRTGSGDVAARQSGPGAFEVSSGSGDVVASGLSGPVKVRTASGEVKLGGKPTADWDVSTASADVVLDIPDGAAFRVSASTISGVISNDHGGSVTQSSKREYEASVGQGGPTVHVKSASGSLQIRKAAR